MPLIEIKNLTKEYQKGKTLTTAVDNVNLSIEEGEVLGLVGESGSGKSTLGKLILGLITPTHGEIVFREKFNVGAIFQDPFSSLNPRMSVGDIITEPLVIHKLCKKNKKEKAGELLNMVNLDPSMIDRYPHEFSGGQRQRISIARALSLNPKFIVADEPVSSLDVAVQTDILKLITSLHEKHHMSILFVSHDLRVVAHFCDRVAVMNSGKIVELLDAKDIKKASHPYTQKLLASVPNFKRICQTEKQMIGIEA